LRERVDIGFRAADARTVTVMLPLRPAVDASFAAIVHCEGPHSFRLQCRNPALEKKAFQMASVTLA
jgi:hypothetical protein